MRQLCPQQLRGVAGCRCCPYKGFLGPDGGCNIQVPGHHASGHCAAGSNAAVTCSARGSAGLRTRGGCLAAAAAHPELLGRLKGADFGKKGCCVLGQRAAGSHAAAVRSARGGAGLRGRGGRLVAAAAHQELLGWAARDPRPPRCGPLLSSSGCISFCSEPKSAREVHDHRNGPPSGAGPPEQI